MTAAPTALFDADALRVVGRTSVVLPPHDRPLIVLGSAQPLASLRLGAIEREGIELRRRRGGGGAVYLHPEDAWLELWWPRGGDPTRGVHEAARFVGEAWRGALASAGVLADLHDGALQRREFGASACFAGLGPGELAVAGAKVLGVSQWRVREGTLVSTVLALAAPADLAPYLEDPSVAEALRRHSAALDGLAAVPGPVRDLVGDVARRLADPRGS